VSPRALGRLGCLSLAAVALVGCTSPEATRVRAGGPGGDTGNRGAHVNMHEGSRPYWRTPRLLADDLRAPEVAASDDDRRGASDTPAALPR
jgi:hypothetical protein